jgi:hypothetical protein
LDSKYVAAYANLDDLVAFFHLQGLTLVFSRTMTKISANACRMLDVALFWHLAKHKEISHAIDDMIQWLHFIFDFT